MKKKRKKKRKGNIGDSFLHYVTLITMKPLLSDAHEIKTLQD